MKNGKSWVKIACTAVLLSSWLNTDAQVVEQHNEGYPIVAWWRLGETVLYDLERGKYDSNTGKPQVLAGKMRFHVFDSTAFNYSLDWDWNLNAVDLRHPYARQLLKGLNLGTVTQARYVTDDVGSFVSFEDWPAIQQELLATLAQTYDLVADKEGYSDSTMAAVRFRIDSLFGPALNEQASAVELFFRDLTTYHAPYGILMPESGYMASMIEVPNPLTGTPMEATAAIEVIEVDTASGTYVLEIRSYPTEASAKQIVKEVLQSFSAEASSSIDSVEINIRESATYVMTLGSNYIERLEWRKTVVFGDRKREEWTLLKRRN